MEHAVLTIVNACDDRDGYPNTMPGLASILRPELPDISDREILDAHKRLNGRYLTICKYIDSDRRFDRLPDQIADEERVSIAPTSVCGAPHRPIRSYRPLPLKSTHRRQP